MTGTSSLPTPEELKEMQRTSEYKQQDRVFCDLVSRIPELMRTGVDQTSVSCILREDQIRNLTDLFSTSGWQVSITFTTLSGKRWWFDQEVTHTRVFWTPKVLEG